MPVMRKNVHKKLNSWVNDDSETNVYFQKNISASTKQHHYDNNCTPPPSQHNRRYKSFAFDKFTVVIVHLRAVLGRLSVWQQLGHV